MTDFTVALRITGDASGGIQAVVLQTKALDDLTRAQNEEAVAANRAATAERSAARANDEGARAARGHQLAVRNLGFQISDIGTGLSTGQSPFIIFAQQGGQVAQALAGMRGALGVVGGFLAGPWGAALITAVALGGNLIASLLDTEGAAKKGKSALEEQREALDALRTASEKLINTQQEQLRLAKLGAAVDRAKAVDDLAAARRDARINTRSPDAFRRIGAAQRNIAEIDTSVRAGEAAKIRGDIAAARDKATAATQAYTRAEAALEKQVTSGAISLSQYRTSITKAQEARDTALKSAQKERVTSTPSARAGGVDRTEEAERQAQLRFVDQLTAKYQPLVAIEQQRAQTLERIQAAAASGALSQSAAAEFSAGVNRDADLQKLKILGEEAFRLIDAAGLAGQAAGAAAKATIETAAKESEAAAQQFQRIWETARERVQNTLADTIDDLLAGKVDSIGSFWKSFVAIGRRSIAETLAALVFTNGQQGQALPGLNVSGFGGGTISAGGGILNTVFSALGSPFRDLTTAIDDLGFSLGGSASIQSLGKQGLAGLDALGLSSTAAGGAGGLLDGLLGGAGGLLSSAVPFVGAGLSVLDVAGVNLDKILAPVTKLIGGAFSGASTGAAIGSIVPGVGTLIGGGVGGLIGAITSLFSKTKKSSSTLTIGEDGGLDLNTTGTSAARRKTAETIANGLFRSLETLADQLQAELASGVTVGSIGTRKDKFVFDPSGQGRTKGTGVQTFDTAEAAQAAALFEALKKGAIELSEYGQRVVQTATDLNDATSKLQTVRAIEDLLGDPVTQPLKRQLQAFDTTAREQLRVAREAGFNLVDVERRQAEERAKVIKDYGEQATQSLQSALDQLNFGSASPLSGRERLSGQLDQFQQAYQAGLGGDQAQIDKAAALGVDITGLAQDLFSTGPEFARIYAEITSSLEDLKSRTVASLSAVDSPTVQDPATGALVAVNAEGFADVVQELRTLQGSVNALAGAVNSQAGAVRLSSVRDDYTGARGVVPL